MTSPFRNDSNRTRNDDTLSKRWSLDPQYIPHPGIDCSQDKHLTDQTGAKDADINNIMATYAKTGVFPGLENLKEQVYGDVSDVPSYQEMMQATVNANNAFMTLDPKIRKRFDNDPGQFLDFIDDPKNAQELINMGLATQRVITPSPAGPDSKAAPSRSSKDEPKSKPAPKGDES